MTFLVFLLIFHIKGVELYQNELSIRQNIGLSQLKDDFKYSFYRLIWQDYKNSLFSNDHWKIAAKLFPHVNFFDVDCTNNSKICSQFGTNIKNELYFLVSPGKSTYIKESLLKYDNDENFESKIIDIFHKYAHLYPMSNSALQLTPETIDQFQQKTTNPIFILYNSQYPNQTNFINDWLKIVSHLDTEREKQSIGFLNCNKYQFECSKINHKNDNITPQSLIYSHKTGKYENFTYSSHQDIINYFSQLKKNVVKSIKEDTNSGSCGENLFYEIVNETNLTIFGTGEMTNYTSDDKAPWNSFQILNITILEGVTSIGSYAFYYLNKVEQLTIPNGVVSIYNNAFYQMSALEAIDIPDSVIQIGSNAFRSCKKLQSIYIPKYVQYLGNYVFTGCTQLSSIEVNDTNYYFRSSGGVLLTIMNRDVSHVFLEYNLTCFPPRKNVSIYDVPYDVVNIDKYAFQDAYYIRQVKTYPKLISIGDYAFNYCYRLSEIIINKSVKYIGKGIVDNIDTFDSFKVHEENKYYKDIDGVLFEKNGEYSLNILIYPIDINNRSYVLPDNVTRIEDYVFYKNPSLVSMVISENVTYIGDYSFSGSKLMEISFNCMNLSYIGKNAFSNTDIVTFDLPDSVETIGEYAFHYCLHNYYFHIPNKLKTISKGMFSTIVIIENISVPDSVTIIQDEAFLGCKKLISIQLPKYLTYLGKESFSGCHSLTSIVVPEGISEIQDQTFASCISITSINIPDSVTTIGTGAFLRCYSITSITIPANVSYISVSAFSELKELRSVTYLGLIDPSPHGYAFKNCIYLESINVLEEYMNETCCGYKINRISDKSSSLDISDVADPTSDVINPTSIITPSQEPEIIIIDISDDLSDTELNKTLTDAFNNLNNNEQVEAVVGLNTSKINFNSELNENQFIKPIKDDTKIDFNGGNLNLILPSNGRVTVSIDKDEANLALKGEGEIAINQQNQKLSNITLNRNSQINGSVLITVSENVDTVTMNSIEFEKKGSISINQNQKKISFNVNDIIVKSNTEATISNMNILNSLNIVQSATMNIENISLDNAHLTFDFSDFNKEVNPFIKGKFNNRPMKIYLNKISNDKSKPIFKKDYTLVSGLFEENMCMSWKEVIKYGNSGFDSNSCEDNENTLLATENKRIVIRSTSQEENNGKKLSGGQIAGIVIGCVAGVALIVLAVFFIIRWKNKQSKSESQDQVDRANEI